jgi:hypothetical protein
MAAETLPGGWHYAGTYKDGQLTAETDPCELRKGFAITPLFSAGGSPTAGELDDAACAIGRGTLMPFGDFGVDVSDPNPSMCSANATPCTGAKLGLLWDASQDTGIIYLIMSDGTRKFSSKARRAGPLLLVGDSLTLPAYAKSQATLYTCK